MTNNDALLEDQRISSRDKSFQEFEDWHAQES